jgi:hypothetical protein
VLRALGQNPTEGEVRKLVQSSCKVKVPEVRYCTMQSLRLSYWFTHHTRLRNLKELLMKG